MTIMQQVLAYVRAHPGETGVSIARALNLRTSAVYPHLRELQETEDIAKVGNTSNARFYP